MENYVKFKLVGGKLKLKKGVLPHKFECQKPQKKKIDRPGYKKRQDIKLVVLEKNGNMEQTMFASAASDDMDAEEQYEEWGANEQQRQLLDNTERLERVGNSLTDGYRVLLETEQTGAGVLRELGAQRETLQRTRGRLREADADLHRSSRLMSSMVSRALQDKFALTAVLGALALLLCIGVYFYVT